MRPYLLDWGDLGDEERGFSLDDYVLKRLIPALEFCAQRNNGPISLIGYCMGGNLTLAAACLRPDLVSKLVLLATPWDFHAEGEGSALVMADIRRQFEPIMATQGHLPADCLQLVFAGLDPTLIARKFRHFSKIHDQKTAHTFVTLEDWANSGPPLSAPAAEQIFKCWYEDNSLISKQWIINSKVIDPETIQCPVLCVIPTNDRIVPPSSARALAQQLSAKQIQPPLGHVGMIASRRAQELCWKPIKEWLQAPVDDNNSHRVSLSIRGGL